MTPNRSEDITDGNKKYIITFLRNLRITLFINFSVNTAQNYSETDVMPLKVVLIMEYSILNLFFFQN